ncbi:MAG: carboxypeptidase-like regulatory domain-containing protein [Sphingobacteriaceae bacterium]|nr:carboxypeptidase-like regulatory domain-containing protein [Sphingobacteriaceae bacterium]
MKHLFWVVALVFACVRGYTQENANKAKAQELIQFSGVVLDQDSLTPIPFVSVVIKGTNRGANSDFYGFFSLVVKPGDELEFVSLIHKKRTYKVADTLRQKYYYAVQVLTKDTIQLPQVEVFPWPTKEEFKRAFLALNLNDTDVDRAQKNLEREAMTYLERNQTASASENYKYVMLAYYTKAYSNGQSPSISLLNPFAWAQFIDNVKKGKYSKKKKKD